MRVTDPWAPAANSVAVSPGKPAVPSLEKMTLPLLQQRKAMRTPLTALTAYDYPTALLVDEAGVDLVLVGDSLGMVVLGYDSTLPVTMDAMLHHTRAVRRGVRHALLVADMPFGSYELDVAAGLQNALRLVKDGGAEAVKIEGGSPARLELVSRLVEAEIGVVAHLGLTPQAVHRMGGYKVQARTLDAAEMLLDQALALEAAGAAAVVLEGVPREVAGRLSAALHVPTIGIGAGPECDGQILVFHDLLGLGTRAPAKFVRQYADVGALMRDALGDYVRDVRAGEFPSDGESYHLDAATRAAYESGAGGEGSPQGQAATSGRRRVRAQTPAGKR